MKVTETVFQNVQVLEPEIFFDERGHFFESFNQKTINDLIGSEIIFVQTTSQGPKKVFYGECIINSLQWTKVS